MIGQYDSHRRVPVNWASLTDAARKQVYTIQPIKLYNTGGNKFAIVPIWLTEQFDIQPVDISTVDQEHLRVLSIALAL